MSVIILLLISFTSGAPGDYWAGTHTFIIRHAQTILRNDGKTEYADFLDSLENGKTYLEWLIDGNNENDNELWKASHHYLDPADHEGWNCDDPFYDIYDNNIFDFLQMPSWTLCQQTFDSAVTYWNNGNKSKAIYFLGWSAHLVEDACVPHHVYPTCWWGHSDFETWVDQNQGFFAVSSGGIYNFSSFGGSYAIAHYDSAQKAKDWVDFNGHFAYEYFPFADNNVNYQGYDDEMQIETSHPYSNNYDHTYPLTLYGIDKIWLNFEYIQIESYYDHLYVLDANDNIIWQSETSNIGIVEYQDLTIGPILGNTVKIRLKTDGGITAWGYRTSWTEWYDIVGQNPGYTLATQSILPRAQQTVAGFINFFFSKVDNPPSIVENVASKPQRTKMVIVPNNSMASMKFIVDLPQPEFISIDIYQSNGAWVRRLFEGVCKEKELIFDSKDNSGKTLSTGSYFAVLRKKGTSLTKKFILVR